MLGIADYHLTVPREYDKNLRYRRSLAVQCEFDAEAQAAVVDACRADLILFINAFVYQYNPKKKGADAVGPFILWPFQERALTDRPPRGKGILWCYEKDRTAVVEKSREMGASWLFLIFQDWLCRFHPHVQTLNISRHAKAVDSASKNSLFAKLRFMHRYMPGWLNNRIEDTRFNLDYRDTESEITGEASKGSAGAGGRGSVVFVDEFQLVKEAAAVRQNTASIADCRFFNGTHLGTGTEFHAMTESPEVVQIQMHWTRHPDKNKGLYSFDAEENRVRFWEYEDDTDRIVELAQPEYEYDPDFDFDRSGKPTGGPHPGIRSSWYDWKCGDIGDSRKVAQELDIDPQGSATQVFNAAVIDAYVRKYAREPEWTGSLDYDAETATPKKLQPDSKGKLQLWLTLRPDGTPPPGVYAIGADVSDGLGATPTCASIVNCATAEKVGMYVNANIYPADFARLYAALGRLFCTEHGDPAWLIWEIPGPGNTVTVEVAQRLRYPRVYHNRREFAMEKEPSGNPGWANDPSAMNALAEQYRQALERWTFFNPDADSVLDVKNFRYNDRQGIEHSHYVNKGDPAHGRLNHGDRPMADMLGFKMTQELGLRRPPPPAPRQIPLGSIEWREEFHKMRRREAEAWA